MTATIHPLDIAARREAQLSTINTGDRLRDNLHRAALAYAAAYGVQAMQAEVCRAVIKSALIASVAAVE